ncbi:MAG TPA: alkaline phosphatase family protein, partial [Gemmataceae bacterium]|nr:alkaline phosphatase family protein [Gemmataceae bacterium]
FWKFMDPSHPRYEPGNQFEHAIRDYYEFVDGQVGAMLTDVPDDAFVLVVSDHGAKGMEGGLCINEWLIRQGYLVLRQFPKKPAKFAELDVDWARTRAWGEGGYYGRVFLNVQGREPHGAIPRAEYETFRERLAREIEAIPDHRGAPMGTRALKPEELYHRVNGIAPDLLVYFGQLRWRSVGIVGLGSLHTFENDTGPDDANHAEEGIFILAGPGVPAGQRWPTRQLMDVAPTLLRLFGLEVPPEMQGAAFPINAPRVPEPVATAGCV